MVIPLGDEVQKMLLYTKISDEKISYVVEKDNTDTVNLSENEPNEVRTISEEEIVQLLTKANLAAGEKFAVKNCSACHSFELPIKNIKSFSLLNERDVI